MVATKARARASPVASASGPLSAAENLSLDVPDQGLHLVAGLPASLIDTDAVEIARHAGLGVRALSTMAVTETPRQGLVIGFSGFSPDILRDAAMRFAASIADY